MEAGVAIIVQEIWCIQKQYMAKVVLEIAAIVIQALRQKQCKLVTMAVATMLVQNQPMPFKYPAQLLMNLMVFFQFQMKQQLT